MRPRAHIKARIKVQSLSKTYAKRRVVQDVSLDLAQGEIVGLLGPNGAGKTTVFYMVVGLVYPDHGQIFIDDVDVTRLPLHRRAQMGVAYLPQDNSLFAKLSVFSNVAMAFESMGLSGAELTQSTENLLEKFGLAHLAKSQAEALSGGERRRTEIARCLAIQPLFVFLDEPFAGIDPIAVAEIKNFIVELKSQNIGVLITDHNVRETLGVCDRALLMNEGSLFLSGTPNEIINNKEARRFYLGDDFQLGR